MKGIPTVAPNRLKHKSKPANPMTLLTASLAGGTNFRSYSMFVVGHCPRGRIRLCSSVFLFWFRFGQDSKVCQVLY